MPHLWSIRQIDLRLRPLPPAPNQQIRSGDRGIDFQHHGIWFQNNEAMPHTDRDLNHRRARAQFYPIHQARIAVEDQQIASALL